MTDITRRSFLKSATAVGAGFAIEPSGKVVDKLIPYVIPPEETRPGTWSLFSTTCRECPAGCGMRVRHMDGRVIKAEGNPAHPVNRGALCARGQSSVQGLYDPDRVRRVLRRTKKTGDPVASDWPAATEAIAARLCESKGRVALLSDLQTGALAEAMRQFVRAFGSERLLFYEPFNYEALRLAHEKAFGLTVAPRYRLDSCDFILSFSADFLETWLSPVEFSQAFSDSHAFSNGKRGRMSYVGPRFSMTAANADDFLMVSPGSERWVALGMAAIIVERGWNRIGGDSVASLVKAVELKTVESLSGVSISTLERLAKAFVEAKGSVALAGPTGASGSVAVETALAAALLNYIAGRVGQTVDFARPHALSRAALAKDTEKFLVELTPDDLLIVHHSNPAYVMPGSAAHIRRAGEVVYLGTMMDETAELADWFLPVDSPLESWGDYEPYEGLHGLMQPTMGRLHDTRHAGDILLSLAEKAGCPLSRDGAAAPDKSFDTWLRGRWSELAGKLAPNRSPENFWREAGRNGGFWEGPSPEPQVPRLSSELSPFAAPSASEVSSSAVELWAWPSVMLHDGRVANRGWLQEAPDPTASVVWGSWIDIHPEKAAQLGLAAGEIVELENEGGRLLAPARITADVAKNVAAIAFGQGHSALGRNARGRGANVFSLLGYSAGETTFGNVRVRRIGGRSSMVSTCATQDQHGREIVQWVELEKAKSMRPGDGDRLALPLPEGYDRKRDLYTGHAYKNHRWAMAIDLDRCTGCGACAVACYAENNLAVVGEEQTARGREMAWLRVIPYRDSHDGRRVGFIPMLCQQCDAAPCEPVCPVFASVHNDEGLNAQVYNRCIGTRYCSHNCPYKVRRFNWMNIDWPEPLNRQLNPEVTVRTRGVMEKCTFCIQRIREGQRAARQEGRRTRDGEIKPACVQTCPTSALVFGDLMDADSRVTELTRRDPRRYHVLEELNTKPAVTYLRRIKREGLGKG